MLFELLKEEELQYTYIKHYNSNDLIFNEGEKCNSIGILLDGELSIYTYTYNENIEVITTINKGEMFGHFLIHSTNPYYLGSCISKKKSSVMFITKNNLNKIFSVNKEFLEEYLRIISTESIKLKQQVKLFAHKNIEDRIMYYLKTNSKDNVIYIPSITRLSEILSLPRPSVSRSITILENKGLIERKNKTIKIVNN